MRPWYNWYYKDVCSVFGRYSLYNLFGPHKTSALPLYHYLHHLIPATFHSNPVSHNLHHPYRNPFSSALLLPSVTSSAPIPRPHQLHILGRPISMQRLFRGLLLLLVRDNVVIFVWLWFLNNHLPIWLSMNEKYIKCASILWLFATTLLFTLHWIILNYYYYY